MKKNDLPPSFVVLVLDEGSRETPQSSSSHPEAFSSFFLWFGLPGYEVLVSGFERLALFMIGGGGCYFGLAVGSRSKSLRRCN
ncbi:unnamed protein product [Arabidopsis thaliana]|uniref:Transmembrane protein n=1 Tax=Arabidopsis thaliana TaxID=3702 RepID=A0A5S9XMJ6_ARATH|nr:unnamed protein product [Arabidopsis thaliana]